MKCPFCQVNNLTHTPRIFFDQALAVTPSNLFEIAADFVKDWITRPRTLSYHYWGNFAFYPKVEKGQIVSFEIMAGLALTEISAEYDLETRRVCATVLMQELTPFTTHVKIGSCLNGYVFPPYDEMIGSYEDNQIDILDLPDTQNFIRGLVSAISEHTRELPVIVEKSKPTPRAETKQNTQNKKKNAKSKRGPRKYSTDEKIAAYNEWQNLDRDLDPVTLEEWLDNRFGNDNGVLKVATSTFYSWKNLVETPRKK